MTSSSFAVSRVSPAELKTWLHDGHEIALLDIREHGQYGEAHLFYAVNVPFSQLEINLPRLLPRKATRIVLYDTADEGMAQKAAYILTACGYTSVHVLSGGAARWQADGYQLFAGVNVPSKTFGELVEETLHTPHITAQELKRRQDAGEKLVILDGRPFSEYNKMSIPGAICCPNGELALRSESLIPDDDTPVIINCAGRTRSIIGAQTLINLGLPNPVYALQNGTQGWYLANQTLDNGATRRYPNTIPTETLPRLQARAERYAEKFSVSDINPETWEAWQKQTDVTTYLFDIRTAEEHLEGTVPGAQHAPGGQLVQATDLYVAVRGARIIVFDNDGVRARVIAGWLKQMGWDAHVLHDAAQLFTAPSDEHDTAANESMARIPASQLNTHVQAGTTLLDIRPSMSYRQAHIAQAVWTNRTLLAQQIQAPASPVLLLASDLESGALVKKTLAEQGIDTVGINTDTVDAWRKAGLEVVAASDTPPDNECIDYLFFVHDRHHGNREAALQYLEWEVGLLAQIDEQERATFHLPG